MQPPGLRGGILLLWEGITDHVGCLCMGGLAASRRPIATWENHTAQNYCRKQYSSSTVPAKLLLIFCRGYCLYLLSSTNTSFSPTGMHLKSMSSFRETAGYTCRRGGGKGERVGGRVNRSSTGAAQRRMRCVWPIQLSRVQTGCSCSIRTCVQSTQCQHSGVIFDGVSFHGHFVRFHLPSFFPIQRQQ